MAVLNTKQRKAVWHIMVNGKEKFPIGDKAHARSALGRINQAVPALTPEQKAKVRNRAYRVLGKKPPKKQVA